MLGIFKFSFIVLLLCTENATGQQYEYVVVGSGPGGGPLAADLARAGHSVLLLEAGSDYSDDPTYKYAFNTVAATNDPRTRWDFFVKHSDDLDRELKYEHLTWRTSNGSYYVGLDPPEGSKQLGIWYPRAAALGGCAMHNAAVLDMPSDENWNYIADITGDTSWNAANMREIFKEIENYHDPGNGTTANGTAGHGFGGWLDSSQTDSSWPGNATDGTTLLRTVAENTGAGANLSVNDLRALISRDNNALDPLRDQATGVFGLSSHALPDGRRVSPATYIRKTLEEPAAFPLTVRLNSYLTRVIWDQMVNFQPPAVMAIEYAIGPSAYQADPRYDPKRNTTRGFAYVMREVVIAGGAFNSPQILKVSGVGPAEELRKHNITVVADLPGVGANLGDNFESSVLSLAAKPLTSMGNQYAIRLKTAASQGIRDIFMWYVIRFWM
jgi:choline dehydrogenase